MITCKSWTKGSLLCDNGAAQQGRLGQRRQASPNRHHVSVSVSQDWQRSLSFSSPPRDISLRCTPLPGLIQPPRQHTVRSVRSIAVEISYIKASIARISCYYIERPLSTILLSIACFVRGNRAEGSVPLMRFYSNKGKNNFYTMSEQDRNVITKLYGYVEQGRAGYVYDNGEVDDTVPLLKAYNFKEKSHYYTIDESFMRKAVDEIGYTYLSERGGVRLLQRGRLSQGYHVLRLQQGRRSFFFILLCGNWLVGSHSILRKYIPSCPGKSGCGYRCCITASMYKATHRHDCPSNSSHVTITKANDFHSYI